MVRDYLKLHFLVLLAGFTAIIGKLITLPTLPLVFWRTLIAVAALLIIVSVKKFGPPVSSRDRKLLLANGLLIGLHWYLFFQAVKVANVSVCLIGMASVSFWTSILEPPILRQNWPAVSESLLGLVMIGAMAAIFLSGFEFSEGLSLSIASAIAATLFSIFNSRFTRRVHHFPLTLYQMTGACIFSALCLLPKFLGGGDSTLTLLPNISDLAWLLVLALVCTVYAYSSYVELLKRLRVFTVHLAFNLEPVYGIVLAVFIFREHEQLSPSFYTGAAVILTAVLLHTLLERKTPNGVTTPTTY